MKIRTCPSLVDPRAGDQCIIVYVIAVDNRQRSLRCGEKALLQDFRQPCINPTLSETVALLIDSWDDLGTEERAVLTTLLWANTPNAIRKS